MIDPKRAENAITHNVKVVFPNTTNNYDTLFGGTALQWMDEIAFITGTRYCRQKLVTVSIDRTDFNKAIPSGTIVELVGQVVKVGKTSMQIKVDVYIEQMYKEHKELAIEAFFTMVAIGDHMKPVTIK